MKRIKVAVIGTGYLGRFHAEKYAHLEDAELIGVVDIEKERAEKVAKSLASSASTEVYTSYKDILDKVDAVSIVTPTNTHLSIGKEFLSKGVHVLMEKPMAMTSVEAEELNQAALKNKAILQIGHLERFNGAVMALKERDIAPMFMESHRLSGFPDRGTDVDVVLDLMIHDIDIILNLVGCEVESVDASGVPIITTKVDIANARLKFKNGCVANVTASRVSLEPMRRLRIFQRDAYISVDYARQHISISTKEEDKDTGKVRIATEELDIEMKDSLNEEIKSFIDSCKEGTPPLVTGLDGKRALEVAQRIQASVEESMKRIAEFKI
ncbi:MAG: Gfo/Idh/MocA family oxidoreductase [Thermodesulfobacteriota bacterium]